MITFADKKLYVKGTCSAVAKYRNGQVAYESNKFQTANIATNVNTDPIRAGLGNGIAIIIPSDSEMTVNFVDATFSPYIKAAQVGADLRYGRVVPRAAILTATGTTLTIDVTTGVPVAQYGFAEIYAYIQEVGTSNTIANSGAAYVVDPTSGEIAGFTATIGKQYKVWYHINEATALGWDVSTNIDPTVLHFTAQMAVFSNDGSGGTTGSRVGWLYCDMPSLKLGGTGGGVVGDQTTADTSSLMGTALAYDETITTAELTDCASGIYGYFTYVPDEGSTEILGLAVVGGVVTVPASTKAQIPVQMLMKNGQLTKPNYAELSYVANPEPPTGTTISASGEITAGTTAGDFEVTIGYPAASPTITTVVNASVTA